MTKYVTFICIILLMAAGVHAGLNTPSLLNPSFEADTLAAGAKQTAVSDWWNRTQYGGVIEETASGVPETPYGSNWGEMGNQNWFYQQIGTWEANMDIDISFLIGSISGKTFSGLYISLWAGGNPALAANSNSQTPTLESAVVATQIAISDLVKPALAASDSAEITLSLSTGETGTVGEPLWLQIRAAGAQRTLIDNVSVELPTTAVLVSPANNEPRAEIDSELKWNAPPIGVVDHYVLYHRQGDPNFSDAGTTVVDPATSPYTGLGTMPYATQYYWRVDVVNDSAETITGKVWNFTTAPEVPQIDEQPVGVLVPGDGTENATFTVTGLNIVNHKWQKDGSPLSDGGKISGSSTDTLTVAGVTQADEGLYSCVVDNNKGDSDETTQAVLMTERLVAHYAFDNDLTDSQGNLNTGVVIDPNALDANVPDVGYDTGIVGDGALSLGANLGVEGYQLGFVKIPGSEDALRFNHLGLTVSAWIKCPSIEIYNYYYPTIVRVQYDDTDGVDPDDTNSAFVLNRYYGRANFWDGGITARAQVPSETEPDVRDTEWHFMTGVYERSYDEVEEAWTGVARIYLDGLLRSETVGLANKPDLDNLGILLFGARRVSSDGLAEQAHVGLLDDVKIYSYPVDSYAIAKEYVEVLPDKAICVDQVGLELFDVTGPDGVPDCAVDMYDFAELASVWLNCNRVAGTASGLLNCN